MSFFRKLLLFVFALVAFTPTALAQDSGNYFFYVIPPGQNLTINDQVILNESYNQGKMVFKKEALETSTIPRAVSGAKLISKNYQVDIKSETQIALSSELKLEYGSIHVRTTQSSNVENVIYVGNLKITFLSADFLAFISGDQFEKTIKVIEGEVKIEHPDTDQQATVKTQQYASTDAAGKLLIPFPFELKADQVWWENNAYKFEYTVLPISHSGDDQRVLGNISVVLDGSKSQYKTGDIFEWTLTRGPKDENGKEITQVSFDSTNIVKPLFTPVINGEYFFTLQITNENGDKSNVDDVVIFVGKSYLRPITIFPDVPSDHPNNLAITYLYQKNVMMGSEDPVTGKILFRPAETINRVEILKSIFVNKQQSVPTLEELSELDTEIFIDVKADHWFAPYVYQAKKMGIVSGYNGLYRPADKVILVEALKMVVQSSQISMDEFQNDTERPYSDTDIGAWYNPYLFFIKKYNLVDSDNNGNINPAKPLSRAEFAELIYRMDSINLLEKRGYLTGILKESISKAGVADAEIYIYKAVEEIKAGESGTSGFIQKGDLFYKTTTNSDGSFNVSLPVNTKYYIEAVSGDDLSTNRVVIELEEDKTTSIDLEITLD